MSSTTRYFSFPIFLFAYVTIHAQGPDLIGYWQNWNDASAPYVELDQIDPRYSVIEIAFAEPQGGSTYDMVFAPAQVSQATFIAQVATLQAQGKKVLISIGGANATVQLNSDVERDQFVISMLGIIDSYGFDGIDIDLEGASVSLAGGTIANPMDARIVRLIAAIGAIGDAFEITNGTAMMLTMAPETAYVQGGMSAFGGIWGAYLPIIDALRDRLSILQVQLYNSGSMYGIDGGTYTQGTADFIVSQTESVLQGFTTGGGAFLPLPAEKVAIGLPACPSAAGGGYVDPATLSQAVNYIRGSGPQPGAYVRTDTYPGLRGLMTWSINWDAVDNCATQNEYADVFEDLFSVSTGTADLIGGEAIALLVTNNVLKLPEDRQAGTLRIFDIDGRILNELRVQGNWVDVSSLSSGVHVLQCNTKRGLYTARFYVP